MSENSNLSEDTTYLLIKEYLRRVRGPFPHFQSAVGESVLEAMLSSPSVICFGVYILFVMVMVGEFLDQIFIYILFVTVGVSA